ncbi:hypothetical protein EVAR_101602_1 [Eumeta japonica]|uniref:Uncharacterized protein n=1 Tax=Eumeta variegata TaxID=151549 RepID=A0A4C1T841_EUMVA|nr:hypothetical protein EVAR_101602_1 [Eumeta japonica]
MVSRNSKKKQQHQESAGTTSATTKSAFKKTTSSSSSSSATFPTTNVTRSDNELAEAAQVHDVSCSTEEFRTAKHYKASTSSTSKSAISESSIIKMQSNKESSSKFSSKAQHHHQEMSDEFSSIGNVISSIDLVNESGMQEPVFSVPIDVVDITTSGSTSSEEGILLHNIVFPVYVTKFGRHIVFNHILWQYNSRRQVQAI